MAKRKRLPQSILNQLGVSAANWDRIGQYGLVTKSKSYLFNPEYTRAVPKFAEDAPDWVDHKAHLKPASQERKRQRMDRQNQNARLGRMILRTAARKGITPKEAAQWLIDQQATMGSPDPMQIQHSGHHALKGRYTEAQ